MKRSGRPVCVLVGLFALGGCSAGPAATDPAAAEPPTEFGATSALSVVEVTTVTTVQSSAGQFLSPRPSVSPPAYLEPGRAAPNISFPDAPSTTDRAKLETALLFKASTMGSAHWHLDADLAASDASNAVPSAEHFFPRLSASGLSLHWPLVLSAPDASEDSEFESDTTSEWTGFRAFGGLQVTGVAQPSVSAAAASLDYDTLGVSAPLVLASDGEEMIVTNRSDAVISNSLLIYAHPGGVGIRAVAELHPGQQVITTTGPKRAQSRDSSTLRDKH